MLLTSVLWLALIPGAIDDRAAAQRLDEIERGYAMTPGARWEASAEALANEAPQSAVAGRALVWLGALALQHHRPEAATRWFLEARRRFPHGELGALAARGLGDVALSAARWSEAIARYEEGRRDASPLLLHELDEKIAFAARERVRARTELAAWLIFGLALAWFARGFRGWRRAVPMETVFLLPVYALFLAAAFRRDPKVWTAMAWIGVGSLLLVTLGFLDARRPRRHVTADAAAFMLGTAATIFIGLRRAGVLTELWETLKLGAG